MAESQPEKERPAEEEGHDFAKVLFNYIWQKFEITLTDDETFIPVGHTDNFQEIIAKAVICEQLLTRQFLKSVFIHKKPFMVDSDVAFILCRVLCDCSPTWDFFKKLLRYTALIAEFFIFRTELKTPFQLVKGPLIWNAIFRRYFAKDFYSKNGWKGLAEYSERYFDVFYILEPVVERMRKCPYLGVYTDNYLEFPEDANMPTTDGGDIILELEATFKNADSYFNWKTKPGKPSRNRKESAIFELSEDESSSSTSSSSSSYPSSRDTISDPLGLSTMMEHLGQGSTSSKGESLKPSGEGASISKEELLIDDQDKPEEDFKAPEPVEDPKAPEVMEEDPKEPEVMEEDPKALELMEDLKAPELLEEIQTRKKKVIESRKRRLQKDVSDDDGPTKAKKPKI